MYVNSALTFFGASSCQNLEVDCASRMHIIAFYIRLSVLNFMCSCVDSIVLHFVLRIDIFWFFTRFKSDILFSALVPHCAALMPSALLPSPYSLLARIQFHLRTLQCNLSTVESTTCCIVIIVPEFVPFIVLSRHIEVTSLVLAHKSTRTAFKTNYSLLTLSSCITYVRQYCYYT